uniref:Uncharacterized protein n=1 Tax=Globodera rostochiensis TaxID=31243 RepID=A0A914GVC9_GLORO
MLRTTRTSLVVCPFLPTFRRSVVRTHGPYMILPDGTEPDMDDPQRRISDNASLATTVAGKSSAAMIILSYANGVYAGRPAVAGRQKLRSEVMSMSMRQTLRGGGPDVMQTASFCSQAVSEAFKNLERDNVTFIVRKTKILIGNILALAAFCFIVFMAFQSQTNKIIAHTKEIIQMKDTMAGLRMDISARVVPRTDDTVNGTKAQDKDKADGEAAKK